MAGDFSAIGALATEGIARWDGERWEPVGNGEGIVGPVFAMDVFDDGSGPRLAVAGDFVLVDGQPALGFALWDGATWEIPPGFFPGQAQALEVFQGSLYVGGSFQAAGGVAARNVARWDGTNWFAVGDGLTNPASDLAVYDAGSGPELYASSSLPLIPNLLERWDGNAWRVVPGAPDQAILDLEVYDDGTGPVLVAGGTMFRACAPTTDRIGTSWALAWGRA